MQTNEKSLEKLTSLINGETTYRKSSELVTFFNDLGFHVHYGPGFYIKTFYIPALFATWQWILSRKIITFAHGY